MSDTSSTAYSNIPVPDPSVITQQIIARAIEDIRREAAKDTTATEKTLAVRLDAMDRASIVLAENVNRVPTLLDREVSRIVEMLKRSEELAGEKFTGLGRQITERDLRTEQDKRTGETAIAAAFQAQKEAAAKSEILTTKLIDGLQAVLAQSQRTMDDKIAVINARLDRGDGGDKAHSSNQATLFAIAALAVSIIVGGFAVVRGGKDTGTPTIIAPAIVPLK